MAEGLFDVALNIIYFKKNKYKNRINQTKPEYKSLVWII